jgi:hypothetical protein
MLICSLTAAYGQFLPPGGGGTNSGPTYIPLDTWSFYDNTNWTSDSGFPPVSFTNLAYSDLGDGASLVVASTNQAWLQFNVVEAKGVTNLSVSAGTVMFWFAPANWAGTNQGGTGPGEYGRLLEVGSYTPDSSYGLWSIYVDPAGANLYFSTQTNDLSSNLTTYVTAPIAWTTNFFHFVVLTYSPTNTALYLDGGLVTNGPPLTIYPGPNVLANGFYIGSDSNGIYQAQGMFNSLATYNVPLDPGTIQQIFTEEYGWYIMSPWNTAMFKFTSGDSSPSTGPTPNVVTGQGNLILTNLSNDGVYGTNQNQVWIINTTASVASDGNMNVTFTIEGGQDGYYYDVFVGTGLTSPLGKGNWSWQGQGQRRQQCSLSELPQGTIFLILGSPQDSDGDGLTDAYENLVSHTDPHNPNSNLDGILDGWEILLGLNPTINNFTSPSQRANYGYTAADWLNQISNAKSGSVGLDNEGNVQSVSQ